MAYAFGFLILALLVKDTAPIGDQYVLRTLSQGLCLTAGLWWLFTQGNIIAMRRYWLILLYSAVLCSTAFVSMDSTRVLLQVLSLVAVTLFFMSYCEQAQQMPSMHDTAARIVLYALLPVCLGSLLLYKIAPTLAFDQTVERMVWDNPHRFKGLFGKPAGIAAASGILLGLCAFTKVHWLIRAVGALSSLMCLYLTLSRSFWVGSSVALLVTAFLYAKRKGLLLGAGIGGLLLILATVSIMDTKIPGLNQSRSMRSDSLENLSGRTTLWTLALDRFWDRPVLGYGYTVGHQAFLYSRKAKGADVAGDNVDLFRNETFSLHNGYVQALLDSGGMGALLYTIILAITVWRIVWYDRVKAHAAALYSLVFLSIANIGETLVYTPATFHAAFYWYVAVLALGLRFTVEPPPASFAEPIVLPVRERTTKYPIVSRPEPRVQQGKTSPGLC